jgi:hypothetical protein
MIPPASRGLYECCGTSEAASLYYAALDDGEETRTVFQKANVRRYVAVHDQHVRELARLKCAQLFPPSHDLRPRLGGALDHFQGRQTDVGDEEGEFLGVVAMRIPGEAERWPLPEG